MHLVSSGWWFQTLENIKRLGKVKKVVQVRVEKVTMEIELKQIETNV